MTKILDAQHSIGQIIPPDAVAGRDAVHFALYPAVAGMSIWPGDAVVFTPDGAALRYEEKQITTIKPLGIADPFCTRRINEGERFWVFLYPNTITSLRHAWTHPAFPDEPPALVAPKVDDAIAKAEAWLRNHHHTKIIDGWTPETGDEYDEPNESVKTFEAFIQTMRDWVVSGGLYGDAATLRHDHRDEDASPEFWDNFYIYTGMRLRSTAHPFSCSC